MPLCSCSPPAGGFALDTVADTDDSFAYAALPWGCSIQEAEKALDVSLGDPRGGSEESGFDYRASSDWEVASFVTPSDIAVLGSRRVPLQLQFKAGALYALTATASGNDLRRADFDALVKRATELYGAPDSSVENKPVLMEDGTALSVSVTESVWIREQGGTRTQLALMLTEDEDGEVTGYSLIVDRFAA